MKQLFSNGDFRRYLLASLWLLPWAMAYGVVIWATSLVISLFVSAVAGLPLLAIGFAPQVIVVAKILKKAGRSSN
jgi:hypothetical protein